TSAGSPSPDRHRPLAARCGGRTRGPRRGERPRGAVGATCWNLAVSRAVEDSNRRLLRARDAMDRRYAEPLDVPTLARIAHVSEAHFIRTFRATFGETPKRYLQRRRVERAMFLLRSGERSVTDICMDVGLSSLGTFSRVFRDIVGGPPSAYRRRGALPPGPSCFAMALVGPRSFGE